MGLGIRVFIIDDDVSIQRISVARWEKLHNRDPKEHFSRYADKCVRSATVVLEFADRKPIAVNRTFFSLLYFDSDGRLDIDKMDEEMRLSAEVMEPVVGEQEPMNIIDARWRFAREGYKNRFKWTPSPKINDSIMTAIFGE